MLTNTVRRLSAQEVQLLESAMFGQVSTESLDPKPSSSSVALTQAKTPRLWISQERTTAYAQNAFHGPVDKRAILGTPPQRDGRSSGSVRRTGAPVPPPGLPDRTEWGQPGIGCRWVTEIAGFLPPLAHRGAHGGTPAPKVAAPSHRLRHCLGAPDGSPPPADANGTGGRTSAELSPWLRAWAFAGPCQRNCST